MYTFYQSINTNVFDQCQIKIPQITPQPPKSKLSHSPIKHLMKLEVIRCSYHGLEWMGYCSPFRFLLFIAPSERVNLVFHLLCLIFSSPTRKQRGIWERDMGNIWKKYFKSTRSSMMKKVSLALMTWSWEVLDTHSSHWGISNLEMKSTGTAGTLGGKDWWPVFLILLGNSIDIISPKIM